MEREGNYKQALYLFQIALGNFEQEHREHSFAKVICHSLASVCVQMGQYSKALSFYGRALDIMKTRLPANHVKIYINYMNVGCLYSKIKECSKGVTLLKKSPRYRQDMASARSSLCQFGLRTPRECHGELSRIGAGEI